MCHSPTQESKKSFKCLTNNQQLIQELLLTGSNLPFQLYVSLFSLWMVGMDLTKVNF